MEQVGRGVRPSGTACPEQPLGAVRTGRASTTDIPRVAPGVLVPLSAAQQHVWFFARTYPDSPEDSVFEVRDFEQMPSQEQVTDAVRALIGRHDAFRVRVVEVHGVPMQQDCGQVDPPVEWFDLSGLPSEAANVEAVRIATSAATTPFRLDAAPLFRVIGIELSGVAGRLVLGFHHLVFDHWSMTDVLTELGALLSNVQLDAPSEVSFLDYVSWASSTVDRLAEHQEIAYWRKKLHGELPTLTLPSDRPRPVASTRRGDQFDIDLGSGLAVVLRAFTRRESTTPFIVLLTAYKALLMRVAGQTDVIVGSPFAGRDNVLTERIVGSFLKPVALRTDLAGDPTFRKAMARVEETVLDAMDHQAVPFHRVVADLNLPRVPGVAPIFQTVFGAQSPAQLHIGSTDVGGTYLATKSSKADLSLLLTVTAETCIGTVEYSADLFDEPTVRRFCHMYVHMLEAALETPDVPISSLPLIDEAERCRIVDELHAYERPEIGYRTVAEPFEEWVLRAPAATAVVAGKNALSYRELNERANQLAHHLIDRGAVGGRQVGLFVERGISMVVAVLATAKTGCPYVPLDPDLPPDRLRFMLQDSQPVVVISDVASVARLPADAPSVIVLDESFEWGAYPSHNPTVPAHSRQALYLLYTSGTTGHPKAVSYPTEGVLANIEWLQRRYPFVPGDASLFKTSYGFDVSAWEIFWPLAFGARVVVARPGGHREPEYLRDLIVRHGVTMAFFVPSLLPAFLDAVPAGGFPTLRWVFCGGEPVSARHRDAFHDCLDAALVNCCGPTEAGSVVDVVLPREPGNPRVPLGEPASNFRVYVLDDLLQVLPVGVPGEMFVGAEVGLAHGYHGKPALTAERFVPDPFGPPGARMYRSGDLCRHTDQNLLEHLGRIGRQVKIRGMRVELAEIEAVLEEHPHISQAAVVLRDGAQLGACIVPAASVSLTEVNSYLRSALPAHMLPTRLIELDSLPVNLNGKVDGRAIEALIAERGAEDSAGGGEASSNPIEAKLIGVFREVLEVPSVGATDSFFELGGHSILVFRLAARCEEVLGVKPSVNDIFGAPSARELAAVIGRGSTADELLVHLAGERGSPVLICLHAASGSVLPFQAVAQHLADGFEVYGLQTPPGDRAPLSLADLAERHAAAVVAAGLAPIALVGWSMGGCIALEIARQWRSEGRETGVVLLDTWLPPKLIEPTTQAAVLAALRAVDLGVSDEEMATLTAADLDELQATFDRNRDAFLLYQPQPFDFPAALLTAAEPYPSPQVVFPPGYLDSGRGFGRILSTVTTREVAGNHLSALSPEHAGALAETIRSFVGDDHG